MRGARKVMGERTLKDSQLANKTGSLANQFLPPLAKKEKPLVSQVLQIGAGDRGRTDDFMLGKHGRKKRPSDDNLSPFHTNLQSTKFFSILGH